MRGGVVSLAYCGVVCGFVLWHLCAVFAVVLRLRLMLDVVRLLWLLFTGYMFGLVVCGYCVLFVGLDCVLLLWFVLVVCWWGY